MKSWNSGGRLVLGNSWLREMLRLVTLLPGPHRLEQVEKLVLEQLSVDQPPISKHRGAVRLCTDRRLVLNECRILEDDVSVAPADPRDKLTKQPGTERIERRHTTSLADAAVVRWNNEGHVLGASDAALDLLGWKRADLLGQPVAAFLKPSRAATSAIDGRWLAAHVGKGPLEVYALRPDATGFTADIRLTRTQASAEGAIAGTLRDLSRLRAEEIALIRRLAHDQLTGLPHRARFLRMFERAIGHARGTGEILGLFLVDLDRFGMINDGFSHDVGDELLIAIARRLRVCCRHDELLARVSGDEFALMARHLENAGQARQRAQQFLEAVSLPFQIANQEIHLTASIGIGLCPHDGLNASNLLKGADIALRQAKATGRNRIQSATPALDAQLHHQVILERRLRRAVAHGEFSLAFQPQIAIDSGEIVGVETLLRWRQPEVGMIAPASFIPLAEETGLIHELGIWILRNACEAHRQWREAGFKNLRLAVNLSPRQLHANGLEQQFDKVFSETGMRAELLEFELTETALMQEQEGIDLLARLKGMGVGLALDDFGKGHSSLSRLRRLPIDRIKIDRSFIAALGNNCTDGALARAMILLAHSLDIDVIAEGVETPAQLELLRQYGCDEAQGYLLSPPVAGDRILELLAAARSLSAPRRPRASSKRRQ